MGGLDYDDDDDDDDSWWWWWWWHSKRVKLKSCFEILLKITKANEIKSATLSQNVPAHMTNQIFAKYYFQS